MMNENVGILDLTCSIVLYNTDRVEVLKAISCVLDSDLKVKLFLIDNSPKDVLRSLVEHDSRIEYIFNDKNLGYGSGHNIAIRKSQILSKYHLILNADVEFDSIILRKAFNFLERNTDVSMVSPKVMSPDGKHLPFCRMLPTPFDLFARRFLPKFMKEFMVEKLNDYLMLYSDYESPMNIPNLPGCFMFARTNTLNRIGGFDENFFMYVEDVDLTRRLYEQAKCIYYPEISIVHGLARGSAKFSVLMIYHIKSAYYYFRKWGWFYDKERVKINQHLFDAYKEGILFKEDFVQDVTPLASSEVKINMKVSAENIKIGAVEVVTQRHYI